MGIFNLKKTKKQSVSASSVQTSSASKHPYSALSSYMPMNGKSRIYAELRRAVPIIDSAINKIVRLTEGFRLETGDAAVDEMMNRFFESVNVGGNQQGLTAFVSNYLSQLLTFGTAIGEIIPGGEGIYVLYNSELENIELKRNANGIDVDFYNFNDKIANPQLVLYSVLNPKPGSLCGTGLLEGLPFICDVLMKIYNATGQNWEHAGNVRYAVICKPENGGVDRNEARERAEDIASAWGDAMNSKSIKDFVAVGDVDIQVIGADNVALDSEVPVRQLLEQIVAKTGLPPFMLGLSWSSTERMSMQQADILTSELKSYRRILTPVIKKIGDMYLAVNGISKNVNVVWDEITLQDECDSARAKLYHAQAEKISREE